MDGKSSRNRWKDENRNPKLYDERTDTPGQSQNGKTSTTNSSSSKSQSSKQTKNDIVNQLAQSLPEDVRISKLLRRLETEGSVTGTIEICHKLKSAVQDQSNANYIRRSFDMLANCLITIMKECHSPDAMSNVCDVFGMMGFVMRNDFPLYKSWVCKTYKSVKILRAPMMNALEKTLRMDSSDLRLSDQMARLMELLKDFLEQTDDYKVFIAITQVIMVIAQNYNARFFKSHFSNIVDIVIGWMMEPQQKPKVKIHCSIVLQSFKIYWQNDTKFSLELLGQLLEDIEGCNEKIEEGGDGNLKSFKDFGAFVGVFNAIIKSIYVSPEALVNFMGKDMIEQSDEKISKVALLALKEAACIKETVLTVNEFTLLVLDCRKYGVEIQMETIQHIIEIEMENLTKYTENEISSFLFLVTQFIGEFKSELTVNFIENLFSIDGILLKQIIFNDDRRIKNGLIKIYHDVLALKNVPVLQAAYKCIIKQFGSCMKQIPQLKNIKWILDVELKDENSVMSNEKVIIKAQYAFNFNLTALSKLATIQNSIIAMYSLVPSILEVLLALQIWRAEWNNYELIRYSVLLVISEHCLKNSNFISSSSLLVTKASTATTPSWLSDSSPTESPVSQHFKLLLDFIDRMLKPLPSLNQYILILDWLDKLIQQTTAFSEQLKDNQNFVSIMKRINNISNKYNDEVSLIVANCNDSLHAFDVIQSDIYVSMSEACAVQMCSVNSEIRRRYSFILSKIPLKYTLEQAKSPSGINQEAIDKITEMENWHLSLGSIHGGELRAQYFQQFINQISFTPNASNIDEFILRAFKNCWFNGTETAEEYKNVTLKDIRALTAWIQWEAARYCVNNKLKTPLGKAQDTFIKIQNIICEHARVLTLKDKSKSKNYKHVLANQRNVRILLGFMESLEKAIYNAAEGSAFAIPPPEKPARTFFRLNASTCSDWFTRNRLATHQLALHCMELEMVIRCSQSILKEMVTANKMNETFFEQILMSLTWALLRNFESDALVGLYVWVRNITGRKLLWIKMASEQAAGHREIAAEGYSKVLKDERLELKIYDFIVDQRKISLLYTGNMRELTSILEEEEAKNYKPASVPIFKMTKSQVENYIKYEMTKDAMTLSEMSVWNTLEEGPEVSSNYSVHNLLTLSESSICLPIIQQNFSKLIQEEGLNVIQTLIQECLRSGSQEYLVYLNILNHVANKYKNKDVQSMEIDKKYGSLTMFIISIYVELLDASTEKGEQQNINLKLDLVAAGRKELNFWQCTSQLYKAYKCIEFMEHTGLPIAQKSLSAIKDSLMSAESVQNVKIWSENVSRAVYEHCKLLYVGNNQHFDAIQYASIASIGIKNRLMSTENVNTENLNKLCVKFYMKISEWIQTESEEIFEQQAAMPLKMLIDSIKDEEYIDDKMHLIDAAVGKLLQSGVKQCPQMPKVWSSLANWCYRWGRKMIESKTDSQGLRAIDSSAIIELIPEAQSSDVECILKILNEQQIVVEDEDIGPNESSSTEIIEGQLRMIPLLHDKNSDFINSIIKLWKQAHRDVYRYYEMCASAYFKFLLLSSSNSDMVGDSSVVTATLRLLRLIVKHALGLQEVLEEGLAKTPSDPWKVIIPQLFSRLNHHEPYVRKRVSELLCRVAMDSPHLIIFPTVVGAQDKSMDVSKLTSEQNINSDTEWKNSSLTFCFTSLLDTLSMQSPKTVSQVQLFVRELRRISLLWDELWLLSLSQVYAENVKKLQNFEMEFQNTDKSTEKVSLFTEKYRLLMRPVLFVLDRLQSHCSKLPETNNEKVFQEKYLSFINETIVDLRKPFNANEPLGVFSKLKSLYHLMQQRVHKRMNHSLKMSDISPVLASLQNTNISMPGVMPSKESEAVYIQSVDDVIHILPTKTKPKKLAFYGSDGKRYTYLFKGMEDLHLDERIMQFLSIANLMMKKSVDSDGKVTHYRAHHYSVIPLGPRSGLISWVDGVIPIFSIYKKWQQREAARKDKQYVVLRPSELFYNKVTPLLKEHGLKPTDNRKDWPLSVQKKAFEELKSETPRDLLAKEFWCTSSTAAHWRQIVRNYSMSLAVMSVIGYIIGLGDRHLDNILVKLASGDIVHIDYNVCFEKGKTLRVPEKVPFRMTQNIEEALGLTGIEGSFRLCCEHVLKSLKRGRETLLTLLEAFVYDPLIDWAIGEDNNATGGLANISAGDKGNTSTGDISLTAARKMLEREVTRDTLAIRFTEIKNDWMQNRDDVYNQLVSMKTHLNELSNSRYDLQRLETQRNVLSKQISLVRDVEALGSAMHSHSLNTLSQRYDIYKKRRNDVNMIKNILIEKAIESEKMIEDYMSVVKDENVIGEWLMELKTAENNNQGKLSSEFDIVKDFLENSNQGQMYSQYNQLRMELDNIGHQRRSLMVSTFEMLLQYNNVIKFYPSDHIQNHRLNKYSTWCRSLTENKSQEYVRQIVMTYGSSFGDIMLKEKPENVIAFNFHLQTFLAELNYQLEGNYQKYQQFIEVSDGSCELVNNIEIFMRSNDVSASMTCELIKTTKCFLTMETSASGSNNLADLIINDRWYMDEIMIQATLLSTTTTTILDVMPNMSKKSSLLCNSLECFQAITELLETTERIKDDFQLITIPETLRGIISQDKSVLDMISSLSNITKSPIAELLTKLEEDFVNCIQNPNQRRLLRAAELSESYNSMYTQYQHETDDNLGKKLFMSCHDAFEELCRYAKKIMSFDKTLNVIPDEWSTITDIQQARMLYISPMKTSIFMTLDQLFMVKRIQAMIEFFGHCLQIAWAFKGSGVLISMDIESLSRPLKVFITDMFTKSVFGRASYAMSIIICCLLQQHSEKFEGMLRVDCATSLEQIYYEMSLNSNQEAHCEKFFSLIDEKHRQHKSNVYYQKLILRQSEYIKHVTWIISCHHWLHEDYFLTHPNVMPPICRASVLIQCQTFVQTMTNWSVSMQKISEDVGQGGLAILQRLKWAAGANPLLNELLHNFETITTKKRAELERDNNYAEHAIKYCIAIINYEMLRYKTPKAIVSDEEFLNFVQQWENVCIAERAIAHTVNPIEEGIAELLDPEGPIESLWIENVTSLIDEMINQVHNEIDTNEKSMVLAQDNLHLTAHKLRNLMSTHHRISADIRSLLKSILKYDDGGSNNDMLREYFVMYKTFIDNVTELHGNVLSKDFTDAMVKQISQQVKKLLEISTEIYNGLLNFEKTLSVILITDDSNVIAVDPTGEDGQRKMKLLRNQSENYSVEQTESPVMIMKKASGSIQKEQRKNVYGVSVWRRIRSKLEGRDPDANKTSRVQEQVDWMIREALNQDNLALLYEGFTSWV